MNIIIFVYLLNYIKIKTGKIEYNKDYVINLKYLLIPIIFGILFTFVNPFGYNQIMYCVKTLSNSFINAYISEFQPINIKNTCGEFFYIYLLLIVVSILYTKKKITLERLFLLLGTSFMTLMTLRHFSLFVIFTVPCLEYIEELVIKFKNLLYKGITKQGVKVLRITIIAMYLLIAICFSFKNSFSNNRAGYLPKSVYPIDSVNYIKENIGNNSRIFKKIQNEYGTFHEYLKSFTNDRIVYETGKKTSELSDKISKDLKKKGMKFVGSTIIYSYLQAIGIIYSHDEECFLFKK